MIMEGYKLTYYIEENKSSIKHIRLIGQKFFQKIGSYGFYIYKGKNKRLDEFFDVKNLKSALLEIKIIFTKIIDDKSNMFEDCQSLIKVEQYIINTNKLCFTSNSKDINLQNNIKNNELNKSNESENRLINLIDDYMESQCVDKSFYNYDYHEFEIDCSTIRKLQIKTAN